MFEIDPLAWIVAAPLLGFLLWAWRLPEEHTIKQLRRRIADHDAFVFNAVGIDPESVRRFDRLLHHACFVALVAVTAASFAAWVGALA